MSQTQEEMKNARLLTSVEVQDLFGICKETLYRWRRDGQIESIRINSRSFRYTPKNIADVLGIPVEDIPDVTESKVKEVA